MVIEANVGDRRQYNLPPSTLQTINRLRSRLKCALNIDLRSECGIADILVLLYRKLSYISTRLNPKHVDVAHQHLSMTNQRSIFCALSIAWMPTRILHKTTSTVFAKKWQDSLLIEVLFHIFFDCFIWKFNLLN